MDGRRHCPPGVKWILAAAATLATVGCNQLIGSSDRYVHRAVSPGEMVGTWTASDESLNRLRTHGYTAHLAAADHRLVLDQDGICNFATFTDFNGPRVGEPDSYSAGQGDCRWHITQIQGFIGHGTRQVPAVVFELRGPPNRTTEVGFYIYEDSRGLSLWHTLGDPDYKKYVEFLKVPARSGGAR